VIFRDCFEHVSAHSIFLALYDVVPSLFKLFLLHCCECCIYKDDVDCWVVSQEKTVVVKLPFSEKGSPADFTTLHYATSCQSIRSPLFVHLFILPFKVQNNSTLEINTLHVWSIHKIPILYPLNSHLPRYSIVIEHSW
jgi:hypothetical protein